MRTLRFYVPFDLSKGDIINAPENTARHIAQVLRLSINDEITLFNGDNCEYSANIVEIKKKTVVLRVTAVERVNRESGISIHLIQAISKGDRMDWVVQKAVELGVTCIQPVTTKRTNVSLSADRFEKKLIHWQGIINSACEQCGRNVLPELLPVVSLESAVSVTHQSPTNKMILNPRSAQRIRDASFDCDSFVLAVGPEGGFDDAEVELLIQSGFGAYSLGPRILRTETAAISCITLLQALKGDL